LQAVLAANPWFREHLLYEENQPLDKQIKTRLTVRLEFRDDEGKLLKSRKIRYSIVPDPSLVKSGNRVKRIGW
jgi:hypothetical protein